MVSLWPFKVSLPYLSRPIHALLHPVPDTSIRLFIVGCVYVYPHTPLLPCPLSPVVRPKLNALFDQGEDSSPASFERALSTLSKKITDTQARLDQTRANSRRAKVLWTLYLSFAYLVYAIVLTLVIGWQNLGPLEWTAMAGGPVL